MINFQRPKRRVTKVFIHCTSSDHAHHDQVKVVREWHLARGFSDIGYHFLIGFDGRVQNGRSLETRPAAQAGHNTGSIAIALAGGQNGTNKAFTQAQFDSLRRLCTQINDAFSGKVTFHGHEEIANKACPVFDYRRELGLSDSGHLRGPRPVLSQSRTMQGTRLAASGVAALGLAETVEATATLSPLLMALLEAAPLVAASVIALGLGWILWARIDDHRRGLR